MNVFEDLIVELKQENLLERTENDHERFDAADNNHINVTEMPIDLKDMVETWPENAEVEKVKIVGYDSHLHDTDEPVIREAAPPPPKKPRNGQEFYRKRAVGEVSNLQMVEHVLTGVEREYMHIVPNVFEDFNAKKALNAFLQITENENSAEHQEAEFTLMTETEAWCSALGERDSKVLVSNLRQYCETSRPPLSSQALVALARFYRNLPHSGTVRSKFDFVITRLFSRPTENENRVCLFTSDETLAHVNTLYREWSSIALYGAAEDESDVMLAALSFEDLAIEAENAGSFDQLIGSDFFGRLRLFKESINETFYAPSVLVAAIDANVRVGNAFVRLIGRERQRTDVESIQSKYGAKHDESVSEGAARTLELVDLLRSPLNNITPVEQPADEPPATESIVPESAPVAVAEPVKTEVARPPFIDKIIANALSVNPWLLGVSLLLIAASFGVYLYSNYYLVEPVANANVVSVDIDEPAYKQFVSTGRINGGMLYGILMPSWDTLSEEKRQEVLLKIYQAGKFNGYTQVTLMTKEGKIAGFASPTNLDVNMD